MNDFLFLSASPNQQASHAYRFADALLKTLAAKYPGMSVDRRDLAANPLAPLSAAYGAALAALLAAGLVLIRYADERY